MAKVSLFQLRRLAADAERKVKEGTRDALCFHKKIVCATRDQLHRVMFERSSKGGENESYDGKDDEFEAWEEKNQDWIRKAYASIEEFFQWMIYKLHKLPDKKIRVIGAYLSISEHF